MKTLLFLAQILVDHTAADKTPPDAFLDKGRSLRILFGHQSVGGNILEGLEELGNDKRFAIERSETALWDFEVGENENPRGKIEHFVRKSKECGKKVDVAMMKFCFVDFNGDTDVKALFAKYRDAMESLEKDFPKVRFVWWTAPLADSDNAPRHAFNQLMRDYCAAKKKALFDLADLESHDAGGKAHLVDGVPALCPKYTDDGGHLNEAARRRAAKAFWVLLARIAGWDGK